MSHPPQCVGYLVRRNLPIPDWDFCDSSLILAEKEANNVVSLRM